MAEKGIGEFDLIAGLDLRTPDIIRSCRTPKNLTNLEFSDNGLSLRARRGVHLRGQPGDFIGLADYHYSDAVTGATQEQIVAMAQRLWKLNSTTFTITRAGAAPYLWHHEMNLDTASGHYHFKLYDGDTKVFDQDCGTGLVEFSNGMISVWQLVENINSGTGGLFTATQPTRSAKVDVQQLGVTTITVFTGHTFAVGDVAVFIDYAQNLLEERKIFSEAIHGAGPDRDLTFGSNAGAVDVFNLQILGPAAVPAASLYISTGEINNVALKTLSFQFWDYIPSVLTPSGMGIGQAGFDQNPWTRYWGTRRTSGFKLPNFLNIDNNLHIFTNGTSSTALRPYDNYPFKYDGQSCYRSGVPSYYYNDTVTGVVFVAGIVGYPLKVAAGALTGTYKYSYRYKYTDARGIERTGNPSHFYSETPITLAGENLQLLPIHPYYSVPFTDLTYCYAATVAANTLNVPTGHGFKVNDQIVFGLNTGAHTLRRVTATGDLTIDFSGGAVTVLLGTPVSRNPPLGVNAFSSRMTAAQAGVGSSGSPLLVTSSFSFNAGDTVYFRDAKRNIYTTRLLTGVTTTGIYWDTAVEETVNTAAAGTTVPANDLNISKNFRIELFRTKNGGNTYYRLEEIPIPSVTVTVNQLYLDSKLDALLIEELSSETDLPDDGFEHDMPPQGAFACAHQGLMVISGDPVNPNQLAYSLPNEVEAFPLVSNYTDIPSGISGPITAIGSDNENRLAVFKENSYTDMAGDFTSNTYAPRTVKEGDYGVSSHATLLKIDGALVGLGPLGFVTVTDGVLSPMSDELSPAFIKNYRLDLKKAVASNDWSSERYRCYVPTVSGFTTGASLQGAVMFVYDYQYKRWFDWSYPPGVEPSGGMVCAGGLHYQMSKSFGTDNNAELPGHLYLDLYSDTAYTSVAENYADNHVAISTKVRLVFTLGEPSLDKEFLRVRILSTFSPYEVSQFIPHTVTARIYKNFQDSTTFAEILLPFNSIEEYESYQKMPNTVARSILVDFITSTLKVSPHITGIEIVIADVYGEDGKQ